MFQKLGAFTIIFYEYNFHKVINETTFSVFTLCWMLVFNIFVKCQPNVYHFKYEIRNSTKISNQLVSTQFSLQVAKFGFIKTHLYDVPNTDHFDLVEKLSDINYEVTKHIINAMK